MKRREVLIGFFGVAAGITAEGLLPNITFIGQHATPGNPLKMPGHDLIFDAFDVYKQYSGLFSYTHKTAELYEENPPKPIVAAAMKHMERIVPPKFRENRIAFIHLPVGKISQADPIGMLGHYGWKYNPEFKKCHGCSKILKAEKMGYARKFREPSEDDSVLYDVSSCGCVKETWEQEYNQWMGREVIT